jgi:DinB family protein
MQARDLNLLRRQVARMRRVLDGSGRDLAATPVRGSSWSAAQQYDHILKVASAVLAVLEEKNPKVLSRPCSLLGKVILTIGWIPRGRAKSPEKLVGAAVSVDELRSQLDALAAAIERVAAHADQSSRVPIVKHPIFGGLNRAQALRLAAVHTEHHLKIVGTAAG